MEIEDKREIASYETSSIGRDIHNGRKSLPIKKVVMAVQTRKIGPQSLKHERVTI